MSETNINAYLAEVHNALTHVRDELASLDDAIEKLSQKVTRGDVPPETPQKTESAGLSEDTPASGQNKGKGKYK